MSGRHKRSSTGSKACNSQFDNSNILEPLLEALNGRHRRTTDKLSKQFRTTNSTRMRRGSCLLLPRRLYSIYEHLVNMTQKRRDVEIVRCNENSRRLISAAMLGTRPLVRENRTSAGSRPDSPTPDRSPPCTLLRTSFIYRRYSSYSYYPVFRDMS